MQILGKWSETFTGWMYKQTDECKTRV